MLRSDYTRKDRIQNEEIHLKLQVDPIDRWGMVKDWNTNNKDWVDSSWGE